MDTQTILLIVQGAALAALLLVFALKRPNRRPALPAASVKNSDRELQKLRRLRENRLTEPLSERTRPRSFDDIVGQEEGIAALKAALCGPNPQHVIIYGPPGVGKTCAARLVLEYAKTTKGSPFQKNAGFVEVDATCVRFDERSIADPLLGSVHDPIYQGAGVMGNAGIPQPKPGAVTRASGGVLFLDEIGELHPAQLNKLLKVLEDRKVMFESAYYSPDDAAIPPYIHDIFKNGMPADFRLVAATTKSPRDIPEAIRSRCIELYFKPLKTAHLEAIALNAAERVGMAIEPAAAKKAASFSSSGREVNNLIQLAAGLAMQAERAGITAADIDWVGAACRCRPRMERRVPNEPAVGCANGLAVMGDNTGVLIEIEAVAARAVGGRGSLQVTGVIEEEEIRAGERRLKRRGTAVCSIENVLTAIHSTLGLDPRDYDLHINLPGNVPVDGPSAGTAIAVAVVSAITGRAPRPGLVLTGEVTIRGLVRPVGGVAAKLEAAAAAGASLALIPEENATEKLRPAALEVLPVRTLAGVLRHAFEGAGAQPGFPQVLSASEA